MIDNSLALAEPVAFEDLDAAASAYASLAAAAPAQRAGLRERFTRECLPFAGRMARRYRGRGESTEDLEQVARLGLIKAIDRYDPDRGSFTAYAVMTISGELKRHFRDKTWGVHVPRRIQELGLEVRHASTTLTSSLSRTPTPAEIGRYLKIDESLVREALGSVAGYHMASLNAPVSGDDGSELGEMFGDLDADLERVDNRVTVARLLKLLPARERRILALRFYGNRTQAEIAAELGISQMHVSRLLSRALAWLRAGMLCDEPPRWEGNDAPDHPAARTVLRHETGRTVVEIYGEIDRDVAENVRLTLRRAVAAAATGSLCVDLSGVPSVDAAAVAVLVDLASAAALAQTRLRLVGAQPLVAHVLAVCGVGHLVDLPDGRFGAGPEGHALRRLRRYAR